MNKLSSITQLTDEVLAEVATKLSEKKAAAKVAAVMATPSTELGSLLLKLAANIKDYNNTDVTYADIEEFVNGKQMSDQLRKLAAQLKARFESDRTIKAEKCAHMLNAAHGLKLLSNKIKGN